MDAGHTGTVACHCLSPPSGPEASLDRFHRPDGCLGKFQALWGRDTGAGHHAGSLGLRGLSLHWLPARGHGFPSLGKWGGVLVLDLGELLALSPGDSASSGAGKELARGRW